MELGEQRVPGNSCPARPSVGQLSVSGLRSGMVTQRRAVLRVPPIFGSQTPGCPTREWEDRANVD
jgi:hypothetical protein